MEQPRLSAALHQHLSVQCHFAAAPRRLGRPPSRCSRAERHAGAVQLLSGGDSAGANCRRRALRAEPAAHVFAGSRLAVHWLATALLALLGHGSSALLPSLLPRTNIQFTAHR